MIYKKLVITEYNNGQEYSHIFLFKDINRNVLDKKISNFCNNWYEDEPLIECVNNEKIIYFGDNIKCELYSCTKKEFINELHNKWII